MTKDEALKLALKFVEDSECGTADLEAAIKEALAHPEQEPVAWADHGVVNWIADKQFKHASLLYTTPPQRKPLTENEIKNLWYDACQTNLELTSQLIVHLARNIEAAHGIKE